MPELPEVERAASLTREIAQDKVIQRVETTEDKLVYSGVTSEEFASAITGRKVTGVGRYGKVFYLTLDGEGPTPVLHLGMTGILQVKGQQPNYYRTKPEAATHVWPPRFMKFILHLAAAPTASTAQLAFCDARRLGRIRLCTSPMAAIANLGFDPILSMPSLEDFSVATRKRKCMIKALLLDQSFSAGIGNWVADEILFQARVHPEQRANRLTDMQLASLHSKTVDICRKAVEVNAESSRFPEDWLFKHRWGKGKKVKHTLLLPSGKPATIKWIKVGGRTSAFVPELQRLSKEGTGHSLQEDNVGSDGESVAPTTTAKRKVQEITSEVMAPAQGSRSSKRIRTFTEEREPRDIEMKQRRCEIGPH